MRLEKNFLPNSSPTPLDFQNLLIQSGLMTEKEETMKLLTTQEAAREWNIPKKAIYRLVREGKLRPFTGFKSWRFTIRDIDGVLERL